MPHRIARYVLLLILVLAGCETDADKLKRLKTDAIIMRGLLIAEENTYDSARIAYRDQHPFPTDSATKIRWFDSMHVALKPYSLALDSVRNRHTLADRELRLFLDGR